MSRPHPPTPSAICTAPTTRNVGVVKELRSPFGITRACGRAILLVSEGGTHKTRRKRGACDRGRNQFTSVSAQVIASCDARCASRCLYRCAQAVARGAAQVVDPGVKAVDRSAAPCASQILDRGARAVARGAARCASQVLDRDAQAVASLCVAGT